MIFYCGFVVHITDTRAQKVVSYISAHIQPFGCLIVQVRQAVQSMRRSVDWTMGVGRGGRGKAWSPLDFEIISKKSFFSISRGKKRISPLLEPPWKKFWENPLLPPPWTISFRRPWIGHWRTTWSTVCSSAPHSQAGEGAITHLYMQERKPPTPVRRRLSRTEAVLGRAFRLST